jgi:beta-lactamase class A
MNNQQNNIMIPKYFWEKYKKHLAVAFIIVISMAAGILMEQIFFDNKCDDSLTLINQELKCTKEYTIGKQEYNVLKNKINVYLGAEKVTNHITRTSVFFRDLDNGPTFGINENDNFVPASLLKLPLMLTYFNLADNNQDILKEQIAFSTTTDQSDLEDQFFKPSHSIKPHTAYSIKYLIFNMITYSDNVSASLLSENLKKINPSEDLFLDTFKDLGIIDPENRLDQTISAKSYASIFRMLYNVSYLSKKSSQDALKILSQTDFNGGIVAGVPEGTTVAHKFGERSNFIDDLKELHDCGIVYYDSNPYLICVMTEGHQFLQLLDVIKNVSKMVYDEVNSRKL